MTDNQAQPPGTANPAVAKPDSLELYQIIIHCRDEAQQRELFERLRREGLRCRLSVL